MIKIPYGVSNYSKMIERGFHYVDRTMYIEQIEQLNTEYLFFVRPRRFGKSLFISTLEYYYGIQHKEDFSKLFGQYYIGQHPTPFANQYLTLVFDFSGIDTSSFEKTYQSFLNSTKHSARRFLATYKNYFNEKDSAMIDACTFPSDVIQYLIQITESKAPKQKIYLLIDEYDHFANEILAFRFKEFSQIVSKNGYVRKFFETLKIATRNNIIDRMFITGVSPVTLDSLTSGFNMATNITLDRDFNAMMGFTEAEVEEILLGVEVPVDQLATVMAEIKQWYDGYLFSEEATERIYNSDMVLYFANHYSRRKQYPKDLLDINIASDYTKIRRLFKIKDQEEENLTHLNELITTGSIQASLVRQFNFVRRFDRHDFISLLYYTGIITIHDAQLNEIIFKMPNYVIQQLYYQYFAEILIEQAELDADKIDLFKVVRLLALDSDLQPLVQFIQEVLTNLSTRDKQNFNEKHIKSIATAALFTSGIYTIHNEFEVKKSATQKGFVDILLIRRSPFKPNYQFAIELKYLKKEEAKKLPEVRAAAKKQLQAYLRNDLYLQQLKDLRAYLIIFVGNEGTFEEII